MPAVKGKDGPAPSKTIQFTNFEKGWVRNSARDGLDDEALWECLNAQVIGPGDIRTLTGPGPSIATITPTVVSLWGVMIELEKIERERLIAISSDGSARAIDPLTGGITVICAAGQLDPTCRLTMWRDTHVLFAGRTTGYSSWDGTSFLTYPTIFTGTTTAASGTVTWTGGPTPLAALSGGMAIEGTGIPAGTIILAVDADAGTLTIGPGNATASGTVTLTIGAGAPVGSAIDPESSGPRDVAVFEGRAWLVSGNRGIIYTGPGSFTTFGLAYAGFATTMPDSIFPGQITTIRAAIQLLWIFGPGAINTISNVQVTTGGVTLFQNENLVAGTGTALADSVQPLFRTMVFLSPPGVYAILGATPQKLSDNLDALMPEVTPVTTAPGAVFNLNSLLCYAVLVNVEGQRRVLVYSRPTWLLADQGADLSWITTLVRTDGQIQCWSTNGTEIRQLFAGTVADWDVRLKMFDFDMFTRRDTMRRIAVQARVLEAESLTEAPDLQVEVENETTTAATLGGILSNEVTWINDAMTVIPWVNALSEPVTWTAGGNLIYLSEVKFSGNLLSAHLFGRDSLPLILGGVAMEIGIGGEWTFAP